MHQPINNLSLIAKTVSSTRRDLSRWLGDKAEEWAETERGVELAGGLIDGELAGVGDAVEVKGCRLRYGDGDSSGRYGRVRVWRNQFQELQEADGLLLVIVYSLDAAEPVQHSRFVHWSSLQQLMQEGGYNWYSAREHPMGSEQTQIPWYRFFPELELP